MPLIIVILAFLGAGGAVLTSDSARPGDLLFPLDRSVEDIRLALTPEQGKADLRVKFAKERLDEIESILDEESDDDADDAQATSTPSSEVSDEARQNLSHALDILTTHLAEVRGAASTTPGIAEAIGAIETRLLSGAGALPQELRVRVRGDDGKIELKTEDEKIRVKIDGGKIEVKIESEDDDEDLDDDSDRRGSNSGPSATSTRQGNDDDEVSGPDDDDSDDSGSSGRGGNPGSPD